MIFVPSMINVSDTTGIKQLKCIKVLKKNTGMIGTTIVASIKKTSLNKTYKPGQICRAIIVRVKKNMFRASGEYVYFFKNDAALLQNDKTIASQTVVGVLPIQLKKHNAFKLYSLKNVFI